MGCGPPPPQYGSPCLTVASIERLKKIAANLKATVIIQHDARDVKKIAGVSCIRKVGSGPSPDVPEG